MSRSSQNVGSNTEREESCCPGYGVVGRCCVKTLADRAACSHGTPGCQIRHAGPPGLASEDPCDTRDESFRTPPSEAPDIALAMKEFIEARAADDLPRIAMAIEVLLRWIPFGIDEIRSLRARLFEKAPQ